MLDKNKIVNESKLKRIANAEEQLDILHDRSRKHYALYATYATGNDPDIITDEEMYRNTLYPDTLCLNPIMKSANIRVKDFLTRKAGKLLLMSKGMKNVLNHLTFIGVYRYVRESVQQEFGEEFAGKVELGYDDEGRFMYYNFISSKPEVQQYAQNLLENLIKDVTVITDFDTFCKERKGLCVIKCK